MFRWRWIAATAGAITACSLFLGCATVPAYDRGYLADPTMQSSVDPLADRSVQKMHQSREGASGGDANPAGGGCACSN